MRDVMERIFDQSLKYSVRIDDHNVTRPASIMNNNSYRRYSYEFYRIAPRWYLYIIKVSDVYWLQR